MAWDLAATLEQAEMTEYAAQDIFGDSGLSLPGVRNTHVDKERTRNILSEALSPLLRCRDNDHGKPIIAHG